ncbi:MAG: 2-(1,2-epoxy-1,2-dihydrophenyl)acetyl-CoA isomerase PaaG [Granulosicoccus sp.]|nr:2-(1,2-epoxy-1,2-dihydrophenyl)acetyl-CoA isomerase PaaG [Granulosicoccus sp.]
MSTDINENGKTPPFETIDFQVDAGVATLVLSRPDKLNTFTEQMHAEIRDALSVVATETDIRCLLITGNGKGFCAGQDLADLDMSALSDVLEKNYNPLVKSIVNLDKPVICAVNGVAAGAGANLALACDIVVAGRSASFIQAFSKIGLVPDAGGTWTLPRTVGAPRAMALAMLGDKVSAEQAAAWGMIWEVVDDQDLSTHTQALARHLAAQPTAALALTKRLLRESFSRTLEEQLDLERDFQSAASRTADFREGVDAFLNKRAARFTGQ